MKTSEFISKLESRDYSVYDRGEVLEVVHNTKNDVSVVIGKKDQFYLRSDGSNNKVDEYIFEICYEYSRTPIEDREEEEKKYRLKLPSPFTIYLDEYVFLTIDKQGRYSFDIIEDCVSEGLKFIFTEKEIDNLLNQDFIKTLVKEEVLSEE